MQSDLEPLFLYKVVIITLRMSCGSILPLQHLTKMSCRWGNKHDLQLRSKSSSSLSGAFQGTIIPMALLSSSVVGSQSRSSIIGRLSIMFSASSEMIFSVEYRREKCWTYLSNCSFLLCKISPVFGSLGDVNIFCLYNWLFYSLLD